MRAPTADVLHSSLQHGTEDIAEEDGNEERDNAHAANRQQLPTSRIVIDNVGELEMIVSQGNDGLATACKTPLHEHIVHEGFGT